MFRKYNTCLTEIRKVLMYKKLKDNLLFSATAAANVSRIALNISVFFLVVSTLLSSFCIHCEIYRSPPTILKIFCTLPKRTHGPNKPRVKIALTFIGALAN